jgi:hypothetical protein
LIIVKLDKSRLFVNVCLLGVKNILKVVPSEQVFVHLVQVEKLGDFLAWQLDDEDVSIKASFSWCEPI